MAKLLVVWTDKTWLWATPLEANEYEQDADWFVTIDLGGANG